MKILVNMMIEMVIGIIMVKMMMMEVVMTTLTDVNLANVKMWWYTSKRYNDGIQNVWVLFLNYGGTVYKF